MQIGILTTFAGWTFLFPIPYEFSFVCVHFVDLIRVLTTVADLHAQSIVHYLELCTEIVKIDGA